MNLTQSFAKLVQSLTYRRAWRRIRRLIHPIKINPLLDKVRTSKFLDLRNRHNLTSLEISRLSRHYLKYLDAEKHVRLNIQRAQDLNLHRLPPQEILDIGCGGGYFLFVTKALGHHGLGLDVASIPVFNDLIHFLEVERYEYQLKPFQALPDFGRRFDLVTAFATAFHGGQEDSWRWGEGEWDFFLLDLKQHLRPGGRIFLDLNAAYRGKYYTPEILRVFQRHDGEIERGNILFSPKG